MSIHGVKHKPSFYCVNDALLLSLFHAIIDVSERLSFMGIIRLLLAVAVLLFHCPPGVVVRYIHPALAVQCFYAISGFLIQMAIRANYQGRPGWQRRFYISRVLRIYPLYLLFLMLTVTLVGSGYLGYYVNKGAWGAAAVWALNNALIVGQDVLRFFYFDLNASRFMVLPQGDAERAAVQGVTGSMTALGQSWTLALELYFYLLAPFLLVQRSRVLMMLVPPLVALRLGLGYLGHYQAEWVYGFFPSELAVFLSGSLACRAYFALFQSGRLARLCERAGLPSGDRAVLALSALTVGAVCWVYTTTDLNFVSAYAHVRMFFPSGSWGAPLGAPAGYWLVLLMTVLALPCAFHFSKQFTWDRFIGELSYPVYISHFLVLQLIEKEIQPSGEGTRYVGLAVLTMSVLLSVGLVVVVEQPVDRWRHRLFYSRAGGKTQC